jgi:hypothetical protein
MSVMQSKLWLGFPSLVLAFAACSPSGDEHPASGPANLPTEPSELPYHFTDITEESGLSAFTQVNGTPEKRFVVESFGAGNALFDADNDGDMDVYLSNGGQLEGLAKGQEPRDALFLNDGKAHFTDGTEAAGLGDRNWTNGVRTVDLDSDGDVEMYLTNYGPNVLYDNVGGGKFVDVTERAGLDDREWSTGAAFFDFDKDGDLDLYVGEYLEFDEEQMLRERPRGVMHGHNQTVASGKRIEDIAVMKGPMGLDPSPDRFFLNTGDARFRDASEEVGITGVKRYSFQVLTFDFDLDGWLDVFVVNDVLEDLLWHNEGGQRFKEFSLRAGVAVRKDGVPQGGMGGTVGDYDNDLIPDLFVTNFVEDYSTLFHGLKGGFFDDVTTKMGLRKDTWLMVGWGCGFVDFDSDGDVELFQINGHTFPQVDEVDLGTSYKQKNQLWELKNGRYVTPPGAGGPDFNVARAGRSSAIGDIDGDGDQDLLIGNLDDHPTLLRNDSRNGHWVLVQLAGANTKGNGGRGAIGARVVLRAGEKSYLRLIGAGSGFFSSNDPREHFGLGTATKVDELGITWADGRSDHFEDLEVDRLYVIEDGGGVQPSRCSGKKL